MCQPTDLSIPVELFLLVSLRLSPLACRQVLPLACRQVSQQVCRQVQLAPDLRLAPLEVRIDVDLDAVGNQVSVQESLAHQQQARLPGAQLPVAQLLGARPPVARLVSGPLGRPVHLGRPSRLPFQKKAHSSYRRN